MSYNLKAIGTLPRFPGLKNCYQSDEGFILSDCFGSPLSTEILNNEFEFKEDDVFVVSFPKTGTTWLQEIVYLIGSNLDYETAKNTKLFDRCPYLEGDGALLHFRDLAEKLSSPRFLKLHYPYSMIPKPVIDKKCKILCPIRNPKDTVVSYYFFSKMSSLMDFEDDFPVFFDLFLEGKVVFGPYWKHILEFWNLRHQDNILVIKYEDMKKDLLQIVKDICKFLGKSYSQQQLEEIVRHCSFSEMKGNSSANPDLAPEYKSFLDSGISPFMRKGEVGDWKNYFTDEMNQRMDKYIEDHFSGSGLEFEYE